mgnify:CR=1 FL=1
MFVVWVLLSGRFDGFHHLPFQMDIEASLATGVAARALARRDQPPPPSGHPTGILVALDARTGQPVWDAPPEVYGKLKTRVTDLHPMTIIQNARTSGGGQVALVPMKAATVGPVETWSVTALGGHHAVAVYYTGYSWDEGRVLDPWLIQDNRHYSGVYWGQWLLNGGAGSSHTAILARTFGVPMVAGVGEALREISSGEEVLVDGFSGQVGVGIGEAERVEAESRRQRFVAFLDGERDAGRPHTDDGVEVLTGGPGAVSPTAPASSRRSV